MKIGLVGFSGSGKSTVFQWLTGAAPDAARVQQGQTGMAKLPDPRVDRMAAIEEALRGSDDLQKRLTAINGRRDAGVHSLGEIWRRHRLSCPSREQLVPKPRVTPAFRREAPPTCAGRN